MQKQENEKLGEIMNWLGNQKQARIEFHDNYVEVTIPARNSHPCITIQKESLSDAYESLKEELQ